VSALDTEHFENALLWAQNGSTTNGAHFDTRHSDGHQEVFAVVDPARRSV
jgi:hypothetical protein